MNRIPIFRDYFHALHLNINMLNADTDFSILTKIYSSENF